MLNFARLEGLEPPTL